MLKTFLLLLLVSTLQFSCRTTGGDKSEAWSSPVNRAAALVYIKKTVNQLFPEIAVDDPALAKFADALEDATTKQVESAQYLLEKYNEQRRINPDDTNAEIAGYIAEHFIAMTNYVEIFAKQSTKLRFIGLDEKLSNPKT